MQNTAGATSPDAAAPAGSYAEDPNYNPVARWRNAVKTLAGTLGGRYAWNGRPTAARFR